MQLETGDMWSIHDKTDYFIVTTNSYIRTDGAVVMGRGIAKQLADHIPSIAFEFANDITHLGRYGIILLDKYGAFQVKKHFSNDAEYALIAYAAAQLAATANVLNKARFDMNFPGIGNGNLDYNEVLPLINHLPDNVHVWTFT